MLALNLVTEGKRLTMEMRFPPKIFVHVRVVGVRLTHAGATESY